MNRQEFLHHQQLLWEDEYQEWLNKLPDMTPNMLEEAKVKLTRAIQAETTEFVRWLQLRLDDVEVMLRDQWRTRRQTNWKEGF